MSCCSVVHPLFTPFVIDSKYYAYDACDEKKKKLFARWCNENTRYSILKIVMYLEIILLLVLPYLLRF